MNFYLFVLMFIMTFAYIQQKEMNDEDRFDEQLSKDPVQQNLTLRTQIFSQISKNNQQTADSSLSRPKIAVSYQNFKQIMDSKPKEQKRVEIDSQQKVQKKQEFQKKEQKQAKIHSIKGNKVQTIKQIKTQYDKQIKQIEYYENQIKIIPLTAQYGKLKTKMQNLKKVNESYELEATPKQYALITDQFIEVNQKAKQTKQMNNSTILVIIVLTFVISIPIFRQIRTRNDFQKDKNQKDSSLVTSNQDVYKNEGQKYYNQLNNNSPYEISEDII